MTNEIIEAFMNTLKYQTIEDVEVAVIDNQLKKITLKIEDGPIIHIEPNENNSLEDLIDATQKYYDLCTDIS